MLSEVAEFASCGDKTAHHNASSVRNTIPKSRTDSCENCIDSSVPFANSFSSRKIWPDSSISQCCFRSIVPNSIHIRIFLRSEFQWLLPFPSLQPCQSPARASVELECLRPTKSQAALCAACSYHQQREDLSGIAHSNVDCSTYKNEVNSSLDNFQYAESKKSAGTWQRPRRASLRFRELLGLVSALRLLRGGHRELCRMLIR